MDANSAVIVNEEDTLLREDLDPWLNELAPARTDFQHPGRFESGAALRLQGLLLGHQVVASFSEGRLDLGPRQSILFVELEGLRPKRLLIKMIGE